MRIRLRSRSHLRDVHGDQDMAVEGATLVRAECVADDVFSLMWTVFFVDLIGVIAREIVISFAFNELKRSFVEKGGGDNIDRELLEQ